MGHKKKIILQEYSANSNETIEREGDMRAYNSIFSITLNNIQSSKNSDERIAIIAYLQWNLKKGVLDLPCYSCPTWFQKDNMEMYADIIKAHAASQRT